MKGPYQGYAEGYYGKLLSWQERLQILDTLQQLNLNTYYYAPKEDPWHRLEWRTAYDLSWREHFREFCTQATQRGIHVVAGVAPGLNFDFSHLPDGRDFQRLKEKCEILLIEGADCISLLMDDIDADFAQRSGEFTSEGAAHAALANTLAKSLSCSSLVQTALKPDNDCTGSLCLWVTPRIYADELTAEAPDYLHNFMSTLDQHHVVLYCGSDVVARQIDAQSINSLRVDGAAGVEHEVVIWDNLYANDYCPRRLFVGPWRLRHGVNNILLNPTGMINTDCLLLELMAQQLQLDIPSTLSNDEKSTTTIWQNTLRRHNVPKQFFTIAQYFLYPVFNQNSQTTGENQLCDDDTIRAAIEHCLWRWKTPLSREWYPFLFGLKHDLLTEAGEHPVLRIYKTQPCPLSQSLVKLRREDGQVSSTSE